MRASRRVRRRTAPTACRAAVARPAVHLLAAAPPHRRMCATSDGLLALDAQTDGADHGPAPARQIVLYGPDGATHGPILPAPRRDIQRHAAAARRQICLLLASSSLELVRQADGATRWRRAPPAGTRLADICGVADGHIASVSERGIVHLHDLATGVPLAALALPTAPGQRGLGLLRVGDALLALARSPVAGWAVAPDGTCTPLALPPGAVPRGMAALGGGRIACLSATGVRLQAARARADGAASGCDVALGDAHPAALHSAVALGPDRLCVADAEGALLLLDFRG